MNYEAQLKFLRDTLKKMNIQSFILDPTVQIDDGVDLGLRRFLYGSNYSRAAFEPIFDNIEPNTVYRYTDSFLCKYICLLLPDIKPDLILVIGPFLTTDITQKLLLETGEKNGLSPALINKLQLYYSGVSTLPEFNQLLMLVDTLAETLWGKDNYSFTDYSEASPNFAEIAMQNASQSEQGLDMKIMEARYAFENQLMEAVTHGQIHKAEMLFSHFGELNFDQRLTDSLRNLKNYSIICNTLLRKAAEKGGVHPLHLDNISSAFARKIETVQSAGGITPLMKDMFSSYCRLVKTHSIKQFSPPVQKAITTISADLTADLSLSRLADMQNISPGYLSAVFKKETGQTITNYVNQKRMKHAAQLLSETTLQVQTVAQHCGFLDVHYFSKVFKKYIGKTPKEFKVSSHTKQH